MLTFDTWKNALFNALQVASTGVPASPSANSSATDPQWLLEIPIIVDYGEQRIYRDLDLLATRVTDMTGVVSSGVRAFSLPTSVGTYVTLEYLSVVTPASATANTGNINQLVPLSRPFLEASWPSQSTTFASSIGTAMGVPQNYTMQDNTTVLLGPVPDQAYPVICIGTQRPLSLSSANQSTFLTTMLPDLWMAATMVKASLFMRDWAAGADDPQAGMTWEQEYLKLLKSADREEATKMYRSAGWTAQVERAATKPPRE